MECITKTSDSACRQLQANGCGALDKVRVLPPITSSISPADEIYSIQCKKEVVMDHLKGTLRSFGNLLDNCSTTSGIQNTAYVPLM